MTKIEEAKANLDEAISAVQTREKVRDRFQNKATGNMEDSASVRLAYEAQQSLAELRAKRNEVAGIFLSVWFSE